MRELIRDRDRLEHIVEAIDCILDFANGTRMKQRGYDTDEICKITGLSRDEIKTL
ncbi:MAG: hypothetical protein IKH26_11195 [Bacteroidaceae bacterium]|nr:hypothetical protein [Bacteroidaceae bacterium]